MFIYFHVLVYQEQKCDKYRNHYADLRDTSEKFHFQEMFIVH